jgi:hypothetical protein
MKVRLVRSKSGKFPVIFPVTRDFGGEELARDCPLRHIGFKGLNKGQNSGYRRQVPFKISLDLRLRLRHVHAGPPHTMFLVDTLSFLIQVQGYSIQRVIGQIERLYARMMLRFMTSSAQRNQIFLAIVASPISKLRVMNFQI